MSSSCRPNLEEDLRTSNLIKDGDQLLNKNSYWYLQQLMDVLPAFNAQISISFPGLVNKLEAFRVRNTDRLKNYDAHFAYGDLYSDFLLSLEKEALEIIQKQNELIGWVREGLKSLTPDEKKKPLAALMQSQSIDITIQTEEEVKKSETRKKARESIETLQLFKPIRDFIQRIYINNNKALERAYSMVAPLLEKPKTQTSGKIEYMVRLKMSGSVFNYYFPRHQVNRVTPQAEGSTFYRVKSYLSPNFKKQFTTNFPSVREYHYARLHNLPMELRIPTQAQRHEGVVRINPFFEVWLQTREIDQLFLNESELYLYINCLPLDRQDSEGKKEVAFSRELHALENIYPHIAVITLPSDKGLMDINRITKHHKNIAVNKAKAEIMQISMGEETDIPIKDFYISPQVKTLLYRDKADEHQQIEILINNAFEKMGLLQRETISEAEYSAVYFHFIKFELTHFIMQQLPVEVYNVACRDAIDRAGVHSLYEHLIRSIELGMPLSKEEFLQGLHAAPAFVKGRGLNHHALLIWNAIHFYINNPANTYPAWLQNWHDDHIPDHSRPFYKEKLIKYITYREGYADYYTMFGKYPKDTKVGGAQKVLDILNNTVDPLNPLSITELEAIAQGGLGKICQELKQKGILDSTLITSTFKQTEIELEVVQSPNTLTY